MAEFLEDNYYIKEEIQQALEEVGIPSHLLSSTIENMKGFSPRAKVDRELMEALIDVVICKDFITKGYLEFKAAVSHANKNYNLGIRVID